MARKPSQPALYELIRHKPRTMIVPMAPQRGGPQALPSPGQTAPSISAASAGSGGASPPQAAGPGRSLRLPVGYAYVAIGVALAALVAVYIYGFSAGESAAKARFEERRIEELNAQGSLPAVDPMNAGKTPRSLSGAGSGAGADPLREAGRGGAGKPATGEGENGDGSPAGGASERASGEDLGPPPGTDPRQPGLNYFIVASRLSALEGEPMVRFCRKNGLDAHLVPDDNAKLRLLIVCPGFAGSERRSPTVIALEAKIKAVGLKHRAIGPGHRDFGDLYPKLHKPSS